MPDTPHAPLSPALVAMLAHWRSQPAVRLENVKFAADPDADCLVKANLVAFLMAASLDRGGKSFYVFNAPYKFQAQWGHLDPARIRDMDADELAADPILVRMPSMTSRKQLAKTVLSLAKIITDDYAGDPSRFFEGDVAQIQSNLQRIYGVGPGIARMIIIQRLLYFGLEPSSGGALLPKQDRHINRVFLRSGLIAEATEAHIRLAMQNLANADVARIDQVAWGIGVNHCHETKPKCGTCPIEAVCAKYGVD